MVILGSIAANEVFQNPIRVPATAQWWVLQRWKDGSLQESTNSGEDDSTCLDRSSSILALRQSNLLGGTTIRTLVALEGSHWRSSKNLGNAAHLGCTLHSAFFPWRGSRRRLRSQEISAIYCGSRRAL
jgi:hypothetical protein